MATISSSVKFFINLAKIQTVMNRRFDHGLGGLGFNEFIILYHLTETPGEKLRRIDLAQKIGMTGSGVTRIILPMEKVGLVNNGASEKDARARYVILAPGGKQKFTEALERIEILAEEIIPNGKIGKVKDLSEFVVELGGRFYMN